MVSVYDRLGEAYLATGEKEKSELAKRKAVGKGKRAVMELNNEKK
jgi:hypothetical protein